MQLIEILENKKGLIFDIEGVIVKGVEMPDIYEDAIELIRYTYESGKKIVFLTNLARISTLRVARKLNSLLRDRIGFEIKRELIINPTISAVEGYIEEKYEKPVKAFLISEGGHLEDLVHYDWLDVTNTLDADLVLLGADRTLTYWKLNTAFRLLRNGKELIVLGGDMYSEGEIFGERGEFIMEGAIARALEEATGTKSVNTGKPSPIAFKTALKKLKLDAKDVLMIGDNFKNDIIGANALGIEGLHINRNNTIIKVSSNLIYNLKTTIYSTSSLNPFTICERIIKK